MGHHHHGALVGAEGTLQLLDRFRIEVIGRLIESRQFTPSAMAGSTARLRSPGDTRFLADPRGRPPSRTWPAATALAQREPAGLHGSRTVNRRRTPCGPVHLTDHDAGTQPSSASVSPTVPRARRSVTPAPFGPTSATRSASRSRGRSDRAGTTRSTTAPARRTTRHRCGRRGESEVGRHPPTASRRPRAFDPAFGGLHLSGLLLAAGDLPAADVLSFSPDVLAWRTPCRTNRSDVAGAP